MKYIKSFEHLYINPISFRFGDCVLLNFENRLKDSPAFTHFVENNIGRIVEISDSGSMVRIYYDNIPEDDFFKNDTETSPFNRTGVYRNTIYINKDWIEISSDSKDEIETYLTSKKYNL